MIPLITFAALTTGLAGCAEDSTYCKGTVHDAAFFVAGVMWPAWPVSPQALCPVPNTAHECHMLDRATACATPQPDMSKALNSTLTLNQASLKADNGAPPTGTITPAASWVTESRPGQCVLRAPTLPGGVAPLVLVQNAQGVAAGVMAPALANGNDSTPVMTLVVQDRSSPMFYLMNNVISGALNTPYTFSGRTLDDRGGQHFVSKVMRLLSLSGGQGMLSERFDNKEVWQYSLAGAPQAASAFSQCSVALQAQADAHQLAQANQAAQTGKAQSAALASTAGQQAPSPTP
ncbi:hypothetical protein E3E12_05015 [Formicincola oecophyllae]|uniref:Uncharacterized protein n=1 Tax=Formicincola oecophyllae TaxID=2558361 RepID=A0A4Y6UC11_9PROT|nr:hypothetical protein [Formicincola oecophyllae]QDH13655.1 hypothetical protein E3E12_05015 [Formicincola oecophyllae]